jgi:hypothetical protein
MEFANLARIVSGVLEIAETKGSVISAKVKVKVAVEAILIAVGIMKKDIVMTTWKTLSAKRWVWVRIGILNIVREAFHIALPRRILNLAATGKSSHAQDLINQLEAAGIQINRVQVVMFIAMKNLVFLIQNVNGILQGAQSHIAAIEIQALDAITIMYARVERMQITVLTAEEIQPVHVRQEKMSVRRHIMEMHRAVLAGIIFVLLHIKIRITKTIIV